MPIRSLLLLLMLALVFAACGGQVDLPAEAPTDQPELVLDVDSTTFVTVDYRRSGGVGGLDERAQLFKDGHVELESSAGEPVAFQLTPQEVALIDTAFNQVDFHRQARQAEPSPSSAADALQYEITRNSLLLQSSLVTADDTMPEWARPLIPLLDNLLLTPRPEPEGVPEAGQAAGEGEATAGRDSLGQLVLVEFRRSGGPEQADDWVLVHLDRSYTIARDGVVETGQLDEAEMGALLRMLEAADLMERQGEYVPETPEAGALTYELAYRNLYGQYRVRAAGEAAPGWMEAIADALVAGFLEADEVVMAFTPPPPETSAATPRSGATPTAPPLPAPTASPIATATALPEDTATRRPTPSASPTPAPTDTPTRAATATATRAATATATRAATATATPADTSTPTALPTRTATPTRRSTATPTAGAATATAEVAAEEEAYSLEELIGRLVAAGASVEMASGRIVKPYLSVPGVVLRVDGSPVQVYAYPDQESLAADVEGLAEDAGSIDGMPLSWPVTPHFWRRGPLLTLAVTRDAELVELIDSVLGPQFAGG